MASYEVRNAWIEPETNPIIKSKGIGGRVRVYFSNGTILEYSGALQPVGDGEASKIVNPIKMVNLHARLRSGEYVDAYIPKEDDSTFGPSNLVNLTHNELADYMESAANYGKELMNSHKSGKIKMNRWVAEFLPVWMAIRIHGPSDSYIANLRGQ